MIDELRKTLARRVIRRMQSLGPEYMQSGNSLLANVWDEYCVQMQGQQGFSFSAYEDTIRGLIELEIDNLKGNEATIVKLYKALQMNDSNDVYNLEEELFDDLGAIATNYENARIRKFHERDYND